MKCCFYFWAAWILCLQPAWGGFSSPPETHSVHLAPQSEEVSISRHDSPGVSLDLFAAPQLTDRELEELLKKKRFFFLADGFSAVVFTDSEGEYVIKIPTPWISPKILRVWKAMVQYTGTDRTPKFFTWTVQQIRTLREKETLRENAFFRGYLLGLKKWGPNNFWTQIVTANLPNWDLSYKPDRLKKQSHNQDAVSYWLSQPLPIIVQKRFPKEWLVENRIREALKHEKADAAIRALFRQVLEDVDAKIRQGIFNLDALNLWENYVIDPQGLVGLHDQERLTEDLKAVMDKATSFHALAQQQLDFFKQSGSSDMIPESRKRYLGDALEMMRNAFGNNPFKRIAKIFLEEVVEHFDPTRIQMFWNSGTHETLRVNPPVSTGRAA